MPQMPNTRKVLLPVKQQYTVTIKIDTENAVNFEFNKAVEAIEAISHLQAVQTSLIGHYLQARAQMIAQSKGIELPPHEFMPDDNGICIGCGKPENTPVHKLVQQ